MNPRLRFSSGLCCGTFEVMPKFRTLALANPGLQTTQSTRSAIMPSTIGSSKMSWNLQINNVVLLLLPQNPSGASLFRPWPRQTPLKQSCERPEGLGPDCPTLGFCGLRGCESWWGLNVFKTVEGGASVFLQGSYYIGYNEHPIVMGFSGWV